jgi:hypothetical protein
MSTLTHSTETTSRGTADPSVVRWLSLAGVGYALLSIAGTLVMDQFPDENTSTAALARFYADHHVRVGRGGELLMLGGLFFGLFAAGLVARARAHPGVAAVIGVGAAAMLAVEEQSNAIYALLGQIGTESHVDPAALQAWHIGGAAYGSNVPAAVFMLGVALAALVARVLPRWVGGSALVLGIGILVPGLFGFFASILVWPWTLAAAIALTFRRTEQY